ncbi:hypothetical protein MKZ38_007245 [Zalerion maritima]|uniref:beta-glucosidase n=1 Tax=Zalerion maritima TaxID=339359 RepID=A0AAD5RIN4_9PEZI|nr:hypothetical protein MKZ38_007245 [Zalerion maritima]
MKAYLFSGILAVLSARALASRGHGHGSNSNKPLYKDPDAGVEDRVSDLIGRMSIGDKAAQLIQGDFTSWINTTDGSFNATGLAWNMASRASQFYVGYPIEWSMVTKGVKLAQDYLQENTTLGIPAFVQSEGIHGYLIPNATIFNSPIAYACSFNPDLVEKMAKAIAQEALALGVNNLFAPVVDLARELRFGRVEETFGEDPYLSGEVGAAYVKGLQSGNVAAMVKHYAAFASPEQGVNTAPVHGGKRELLTTYLPPFKKAIIDAGALSVMSSYNCYDGYPTVADPYLLTEVLREQWGYQYWVTSDAGATDRLCGSFNMCVNDPIDMEAVTLLALPAGNDVEMGGGSYNYQTIPDLVEAGKLDESVVDTAVKRVLRSKFTAGIFENPYLGVDDDEASQYINTVESQQLARELDAESIVLLENHESILPLSKSASIAVIGPMAHGYMNYGDYVPYKSQYRGVTPLDGIKAASSGEITYAQGCERWSNDESGFGEAIAAVDSADVAVVVVGTWSRDQNELWAGLNATTGEHIDVASLNLVGAMPGLVKAIIDTGKPTVVVFSSGKPITEPWISDVASALVQQFYPSEQGGNALADILFGDITPSGKLAVGFPYDVGTTPIYYDYLNSGRSWPNPGKEYENETMVFGSNYVLNTPLPLYEFGYGLSYTTFDYSDVTLSKTNASSSDTITVSVDVTNSGEFDGKEVVQLYVSDVISTVVVPNMELKGFKKVEIAAGETETVEIELKMEDLGLWNYKYEYVVEDGDFVIYVGSSSADLRANATLTVG